MTTTDNIDTTRALVETLVAARDAGDRAKVAEMVTEDVEYVIPRSLGGQARRGDEAIDALSGGLTGKFFDLSTVKRTIERITVEGDVAAVEQTMVGTTLGGKDYVNSYVWIYELRDGKFARLVEHVDTLHAARLLDL
jgi:uncharacterized protein (TIGR02246 family)